MIMWGVFTYMWVTHDDLVGDNKDVLDHSTQPLSLLFCSLIAQNHKVHSLWGQ